MSKTVQENLKYLCKICSSVKLGVGLCVVFLYSSIECMFVKPNRKRVETNTEQLLNQMTIARITVF